MSIELVKKLKDKVAALQTEGDKAQGALDERLNILKKDHGCDTIEEAEDLLSQLKDEVDEAQEKFDKTYKELCEKWDEKL